VKQQSGDESRGGKHRSLQGGRSAGGFWQQVRLPCNTHALAASESNQVANSSVFIQTIHD
jgi:hypothetical protein